MNTVVTWGEFDDLAPGADIQVRRADADNIDAILTSDTVLVADWRLIEDDHENILGLACERGVRTSIVFPQITPEILDKVILEWPCIDLPIDERTAGRLDIGTLLGAYEAPEPRAKTLEIGSVFRMPSDPEEYERSRGISLVSPKMRSFMAGLRQALKQMRRPTAEDPLPPPWDPTNAQLDAVDYTKSNSGSYRFVMKKGVETPNLEDVLACNRDPATRERFLRNLPAGRDAAAESGWVPLPPRLLILGESGTGKSLVADLVHRNLTSEGAPMVAVNCAGMGVDNFDHEMFGAVPGMWTQVASVSGSLTRAAYGTAFLDEIGDMPVNTQSRLLAFLNDLVLRPTGASPFFSFTQVVAATNRDIDHLVDSRRFRHDLLARFGIRLTLPALRERGRAELYQLIDFVAQDPGSNPITIEGTRTVTHISEEAMHTLLGHEYRDGNFRELEETVSQGLRAATLARSSILQVEHLSMRDEPVFRSDIEEYVVRVEAIDRTGIVRSVQVTAASELRRVADIRNRPILADQDETLAVIDGDTAYWFSPATPM